MNVVIPLPTGPERLEQIEARLNHATMLAQPDGTLGWQVYEKENPSNGKLEAKYAEEGTPERTYAPRPELLIGTAYDHPQLKAPAPIIGIGVSPYTERTHTIWLFPHHATFIAHAPADMAFLIAEVKSLQGELELAKGFHKVAVAQRDLAWHRLDRVENELARTVSDLNLARLHGYSALALLEVLVGLKDGPRDDAYHAAKEDAWAQARALIHAHRNATRPEGQS